MMVEDTQSELPEQLYTCAQTRSIDAAAIASGIPGIVLMKRAGREAYLLARSLWPDRPLCILCGGGNNGGDGFVVAALAAAQKKPVKVYVATHRDKLKGDARDAYAFALESGVEFRSTEQFLNDIRDMEDALLVDALLGTGFRGELKEDYARLTDAINASGKPVLAIDIPSGLEGDTGAASNIAVNADATLTFVGLKRGLFTARGPELCGRVFFSDLAIPVEIYRSVPTNLRRVSQAEPMCPRAVDAHKGDFGHVLVVGGERGFGGAALLASESALRAGAGLVSLATRPEHIAASLARVPEVMVVGVESGAQLQSLVSRASVIVVGPGLGKSAWSKQLLHVVMQAECPRVLDADALNLLAEEGFAEILGPATVITPHPGEAARLLGTDTRAVQADRFAAAESLQCRYGCAVVLKGAGSLIYDGERARLASVGNPGMAVAGMGDVLSGVIGALLAQGLSLGRAATDAVCIHGRAGDAAAAGGQRGIRASDLLPFIREGVNV